MSECKIIETAQKFEGATGALTGENVERTTRHLKDLPDLFEDCAAWKAMDPERVAYNVECHFPVAAGTAGGLFFGTTYLQAGQVGGEYFMTKGHFHAKRDAAEYYWGIQGTGLLLLMDEDCNCRAEIMRPGSLHYVSARTAHRTVNTGNDELVFGACWPSDAGHDYGSIAEEGFSVRVKCMDGHPVLVKA